MTTPRTRSFVSLAAALTITLVLGGCASAGHGPAPDGAAVGEQPSLSILFDNEAHDYVRVYLVSVRRQWLLGRVEAGALATLQIPEAALAEDMRSMWVTVIPGGQPTGNVSSDARAVTAVAQPVLRIVSQRWTFAHGQLEWLPRRGADVPR